ncbi:MULTISPECIES: phage GP46 family protein [unclassified Moraxella]|uniref:phage GP46 family protein n=1 Tax=unclassified Moraxella TaxID=2685852 RepID=UPI003AF4FEBD
MKFNLVTHDYIASTLTAPPVIDVLDAVYLRLSTQKGSYFADKNLGSELYRLKRCKDTPQIRLQAVAWAKQALEPLKNRYFLASITVIEQLPIIRGNIHLIITLTHQSGQVYTTNYTIKVAG